MINHPFEIPPDATQPDLLSEMILFGELYRRLGGGLDPDLLPVGCVTIKYHSLLIASDNWTMLETTTIHRILEQFSAGVVDTSLLLLMHS